ncbi:PGG domain [Sesbania bispinosa]|nr:PGG domain [Sesbania bispinosa]
MEGSSVASSGIVHQVLTKSNNYKRWKTLMKNYLQGQGLWDVIDTPPADTEDIEQGLGDVVESVSEVEMRKMKNAKALHIIQLSCGGEVVDEISHFETARDAWYYLSRQYGEEVMNRLKVKATAKSVLYDCYPGEHREVFRRVERGDSIRHIDREALYSTSDSGDRTLLHVAVIGGNVNNVERLIRQGNRRLVRMKDAYGNTALALAAQYTGNTEIAKCIVEKSRIGEELLAMHSKEGEIPLLLAAAKGYKEMTTYLYSKTPLQEVFDRDPQNRVLLLARCVTAKIFDVALRLLQTYPDDLPRDSLNLSEDRFPFVLPDEFSVLNILASMPSAFPSGNRFGLLQQFIYDSFNVEKELQAKYQIPEPDFGDFIRSVTCTVVALADEGRQKTSFGHRRDIFGNNLLHLAAYVGPLYDPDSRPGALQKQREIQWFKAVEEVVQPMCKEAKNGDGKKPYELFTETHEELVKDGEKWAKGTAESLTIVGTLITTIVFAAAFTVPGGYNQETGVPIFLHDKLFIAFLIADAISFFTSVASVLIFAGVLTSRYTEKDFLKNLPLKLLFGLSLLFISVIFMIVAFGAALLVTILKGYRSYKWFIIGPTLFFGSVPLTFLVVSQVPSPIFCTTTDYRFTTFDSDTSITLATI